MTAVRSEAVHHVQPRTVSPTRRVLNDFGTGADVALASHDGAQSAALLSHYQRMEARLQVRTGMGPYRQLVVPNGNGAEAVHRWFRLKEGFSSKLLKQVLEDLAITNTARLRVVDPYLGSGTTVASAAALLADGILHDVEVIGYECNPFLHLVAATKLKALQCPSRTFRRFARQVAAAAKRTRATPQVPALATFGDRRFFRGKDMKALLMLRQAIDRAAARGASSLDVDLARLCLGTVVEPTSRLRRDGRALRFVPQKPWIDPLAAFLRRADEIDADLDRAPVAIAGRVELGDGRSLRPKPPDADSVDLVIFSPPYPNNIDYTEVYKMEAWLLGFIDSDEAFREQRLRTVYSHPSLLRTQRATEFPTQNDFYRDLLSPVLAAVPEDRYTLGRRRMIAGYARDMHFTLKAAFDALRPGGHLAYVVGNSLHGSGEHAFVIAADLVIAELAQASGFDVTRLEVARLLSRRSGSSGYLRESVVFARKPAG